MKQIVDKLNKIAKKIDENVEIPQTDLIIDSLDAITKAYGGTPNDSNLIVDKLEDIYNNVSPAVSGNIEITENGENINVAPFATATVNVAGGGYELYDLTVTLVNNSTNPITGYRFPGLQIQEYEGQTACGVGLNDGSMYPNDDPITSVSQFIKSDLMVWSGDVRLTAGDVLTISNEINCNVTWDGNATLQAFITGEHASFTRTVSNS